MDIVQTVHKSENKHISQNVGLFRGKWIEDETGL